MEWENKALTIASFYFRPAALYRYEAGQYAVITLPHAAADDRGTSRTMTLSSSPSNDFLKFTMRIISTEGSSFKRSLLHLTPGSEVTIYEAMGDLVLPLDTSVPLVYIAGGIGIASFTGMISWLAEQHDQRNVVLFYSVAQPSDIVMQEPFDNYGKHFPLLKSLYTTSPNEPAGFIGKVSHSRLKSTDVLPYITPSSLVYVSGPEIMVGELRYQLESDGVSSQQIIFDYFDGYTSL